jgi:NitT/TauT family transport system substrate-binding protein
MEARARVTAAPSRQQQGEKMFSTNRRRLSALMSAAFILSTVAACTGSAATPTPQATTPPAPTAAASTVAGSPVASAAPATAAPVACAPAADGSLTPVSFQLNFTAGGYNSGFALAQQEGIYKEAGLNVTIVKGQGSGTTAKLVASGQAGLAYADAVSVMQLIAKGAKIKILATIYQTVPNAVTALKSSGITKFSDLKGKTIAAPTGETPTAVFPILLAAQGLTEADVKIVPMPGTSMPAALMQHQVDAILGSTDGYDLILKDQGADLVDFVFADYGVSTVSTSIIASDSFLASNGDMVKCFIQASLKGWDAAIKTPKTAIADLIKTFPYDTKEALNTGQLTAAINLMCKNDAKFVGKAEPAAWANTVKIAQQVLKLPTTLAPTDYYTYDYLPATFPTSCPIAK